MFCYNNQNYFPNIVTEKAFSLTHPDKDELHTFGLESKEKKDEIVALIKKQMENWGAHIKKIRIDKEEQNKTFEGVSFKIALTVPVASSHEKPFTVRLFPFHSPSFPPSTTIISAN